VRSKIGGRKKFGREAGIMKNHKGSGEGENERIEFVKVGGNLLSGHVG